MKVLTKLVVCLFIFCFMVMPAYSEKMGNLSVDKAVITQSLIGGTGILTTLDTGQGANELYAMDQDVEQTDNPKFAGMTITSTGTIDIDTIGTTFEAAIKTALISDVAYDATTWDNNTDGASKNAIRDKIESISGSPLLGTTDAATPFETSLGYQAGNANNATDCIFIGYQAGLLASTAGRSTIVGSSAGISFSVYERNDFFGYSAGAFETGGYNTYIGSLAGRGGVVNGGANDVAVGTGALYYGSSVGYNTAIGAGALQGTTTSVMTESVAVGLKAGGATTGSYNTFVGAKAAAWQTTGINNVIVGNKAGYNGSRGVFSNHTLVGFQAGYNVSDASTGNIFLGHQAGYNETGSNKLYIDNSDTTTPLIYGDFSTNALIFNCATNLAAVSTQPTGTVDLAIATTKYVDDSIAFRNITTVAASTYDLLVTDYILNVTYTATGAVTSLTFPTAQVVKGRIVTIKDAGFLAGTNNITVDSEGGALFDGAATAIINTNKAAKNFYCDGTNWLIF